MIQKAGSIKLQMLRYAGCIKFVFLQPMAVSQRRMHECPLTAHADAFHDILGGNIRHGGKGVKFITEMFNAGIG